MTDKPTDKIEQPASDPKRPHATLDLKATELKSGAEKGTGKDTSAPSEPKKVEPQKPNPSAAASPRAPSPFTRLVTHLVAGLAGGAIVLFGGDRIAGLIGIPTPGAQVTKVTADLDKRVATLEAAPKSDAYDLMQSAESRLSKVDQLATEMETLRAEQGKLADTTQELSTKLSGPAGPASFETRIAALEDQLKTISSAAASETGGNRISDIAAVTTRINEAENRFNAEAGKIRDGLAGEIDQRLAAREDASKSDLARLSQSVEKLKADQARLDKFVQAAQEETGRIASTLDELRATVQRHEKSFAKADDVAAAVSPVTGLVSKLEGSVNGVLKKEQERQSHTERIITALELGNLKRAVESGKPFAKELEAVNASSGGRLDLQPLEPFKSTGAPSLAELKEQAQSVLGAALDAGDVDPSASVWENFKASAKSVVRIRKIDAAEGDTSVEATVARIEKALNENRLNDVLAEAAKLPPAATAKIAKWREQVAARASVDAAIASVENELKAALTAPAAAPATAPKE